MASDIRQRMIARTAVLLAQKGLQGTSFSEVLEASGAPRGSLYHHFPGGKDELVLAALEAAGAQALGLLDSLAGRPADAVAAAFIGLWRIVLERSGFTAGCAVVAVTVAADSAALIGRSAEIFGAWRRGLTTLLAEGGVAPPRAAGLAASLIAGCEGAVLMARAEKSLAPFDLVADELVETVRAAMELRP